MANEAGREANHAAKWDRSSGTRAIEGSNVKQTKQRNISAAGRAVMARTGRENMPHANEVRRLRQETTREASIRFQAGLTTQVGKTSASTEALIISATSSFTGLIAVLQRMRSARDTTAFAALTDLLRPLQSGLFRSLQALGVAKKDGAEDGDDDIANGDPRTLAERLTERWHAQKAAAAAANQEPNSADDRTGDDADVERQS